MPNDDTNSGVIFQPHEDQALKGQGKLNVNGREERYVMVKERLKRDGDPVNVLYVRAGVLFPNDRATNDRAPKFSGPMDQHPDMRVAGWVGQKDGRHYISLKATPKQGGNGGSGGNQNGEGQSQADRNAQGQIDDEIPF